MAHTVQPPAGKLMAEHKADDTTELCVRLCAPASDGSPPVAQPPQLLHVFVERCVAPSFSLLACQRPTQRSGHRLRELYARTREFVGQRLFVFCI